MPFEPSKRYAGFLLTFALCILPADGRGTEGSDKPGAVHSCSSCSTILQKQGKTNCYSAPDSRPNQPAYCPSEPHAEAICDSFRQYQGDTEDARLARVAAKVEGLCYQPVPGSDVVNARWTRVEDMLALARLMGYQKIGIATCIGLLDESDRLSDILRAQGMKPFSACCFFSKAA